MPKAAFDKDLKKVARLESATYGLSRSLAAPGLATVFLLVAVILASLSGADGPLSILVVIGALVASGPLPTFASAAEITEQMSES